jgi:DNA ligase-1
LYKFKNKILLTLALFFSTTYFLLAIDNINEIHKVYKPHKPKLLLLKKYNFKQNQNITNWVMSEKLDGIRAYWNGTKLISRGGNIINAPKWFIKNYPPFEIDGELWSKRGDFENIVSIVRDKKPSKQWKQIKHYIFEVPNTKGDLFERLAKVQKYESDIIKIISQRKVKNKKHLKEFLKQIELKGGEGVVVRNPKVPYINKRTNQALKVKNFNDSECIVIGHTKGKKKFKGLMGALVCELIMQNGDKSKIVFKIGSGFSNNLRVNPPKIGQIITFKHQGFTKYGKPRFSTYLRIRE